MLHRTGRLGSLLIMASLFLLLIGCEPSTNVQSQEGSERVSDEVEVDLYLVDYYWGRKNLVFDSLPVLWKIEVIERFRMYRLTSCYWIQTALR